MNAKKRKYNEEYLQYGFTDAAVNGQVVPQCVVVCNIIFEPFFAVQIAVQYIISERDVRTW